MSQNDPQPLEYARPRARRRPPGKRLIPPDQSHAGTAAFVFSLITLVAAVGFIASFVAGFGFHVPFAGYGGLASMCAATPFTILTVIFGLLGLTEEGRNGYRDGTLAKWALWITGICWTAGALATIFAHTE